MIHLHMYDDHNILENLIILDDDVIHQLEWLYITIWKPESYSLTLSYKKSLLPDIFLIYIKLWSGHYPSVKCDYHYIFLFLLFIKFSHFLVFELKDIYRSKHLPLACLFFMKSINSTDWISLNERHSKYLFFSFLDFIIF